MNNSCFKLITFKFPRVQAQMSCANIDSNLTSVHSDEENDLFRQVGLPHLRIGLSHEEESPDDRFHWADSSDLPFANWARKEPASSIYENCTNIVLSVGGKWRVASCTMHQSAICRKKFIPLAIVSRGDWLGTPANIKVLK